MEKAKEALRLEKGESERISRICIPTHRVFTDPSFFEGYCLRGIRVDRIEPGFVSCLFRVPPHLTDKDGNLSSGAIASLVDEVGFVAISADGLPLKVSVDMSISYISTAKLNDELEIVSRSLGHKGGYSGTSVLIKNKFTGEIIAEGRHSLFGRMSSKI